MKKVPADINFEEVTRRIEMEMVGYSRTAWAKKVGVKINVVSNIHGARGSKKPSLNYILSVSLATRKPVDYFLWGHTSYKLTNQSVATVQEGGKSYSEGGRTNEVLIGSASPDPEMGRRVRYWREDMGLSIADVSKRSGLSIDLIEKIEAGHHTTTDVIVKLADALRCSTDFMLGCGGSSIPLHRMSKRQK